MNVDLRIPRWVIADARLTRSAREVLAQLLQHRNSRTGQCNPKLKTLAAELGICLDTVKRSLKALSSAGYVTWKRTQYTNWYEIQIAENQPSEGVSEGAKSAFWKAENQPSGPPHPINESIKGNHARSAQPPRAEARSGGGPPKNTQTPEPSLEVSVRYGPRKPPSGTVEWDPLHGKFLTKTQMQQLTWAMALDLNDRKNEEELRRRKAQGA